MKLIKTIRHCYSKASNYDKTYPVIERILQCDKNRLSEYLENLIVNICNYLEVKTEIVLASSLPESTKKGRGVSRVIDICKYFNQDQYLNLPGGKLLYDHSIFSRENMRLFFMKEYKIKEERDCDYCLSSLSIVESLMKVDLQSLQQQLFEGTIYE